MPDLQAVTTSYADVNGARLYYEMAGAGHPFIMIHAGIANLHFWDDQWEAFASAYRGVRYDIRGYGKSVMPPGAFEATGSLSCRPGRSTCETISTR